MFRRQKEINVRKKMIVLLGFSAMLLLCILIFSFLLSNDNFRLSSTDKNLPPSFKHLFGTDWLGRDMFTRTIKGLRLSLAVGAFASIISVFMATIMGICAATFGKTLDAVISWFIDLFIGMPHLVFMILISFIVGGGIRGIVLAVSLTHWTSLARIVRSEVLQIRNAEYIQISKSYGKSSWYIAKKHILPSVFPQIMIGFLLMFPHVILHEAGLTFMGFGLSPQTPAVGIILSEAMSHISTGKWWLVIFPGLLLVIVIKSFDNIGEQLRILMEPVSSNE
ncbi:ABC transporter permease [Clostridium tetani]|uniref:Dipeptide transport system permease protein dppC n=1 Tax=Clostridium tetani (strain Massachusetts / E88) TaxID=212717 RepID=Q893C5_CLOTE|nr:ABC transporter permease subunit [Clostridium tetani]AAO36417.1 dipeptide transport system permease protein dppC [Clostridium tetani E88]KGI37623.1 peptide ABC transporter permease [Clostridium tetani]KGI39550.1 peptide ABC transporter permease [Clostridium tetani ATCC 9441]KGI45656.1 peptide ABC transporter permease [Clostridium tetani]KHO31543.1 peptide ABC transporter permease [Clostridium tetani]